MANEQPLDNPFPLEAVATYGVALRASADVGYMRRANDELNSYLTAYGRPDKHYGGTIGFVGGHGSGKTHMLTWLELSNAQRRRLQPRFLYAKADSANMFDLYRQLVGRLDRKTLIDLMDQATQNLARQHVRASKASETLEARIESRASLNKLYEESNLDRDELLNLLDARLLETPVPPTIPSVLLTVGNPVAGEAAYRWLTGDEVQDLAKLNLSYTLRQLGDETGRSSAADARAVDALETIAALHGLAEVPLVLLLDQLEVLLRTPDEDRRQTLFSVLKKLIEQLGRQDALVMIAGTDAAWRQLPRDVTPRMRLREPLRVGSLDLAETGAFVAAYAGPENGLRSDAMNTLHELSGGSPREISRIAHHAFEATQGHLTAVDDAILLRAAQAAGSVADRSALALEIADAVLQRLEKDEATADLVLDGVKLDRVARLDRVPYAGLLVSRATDQISEVNRAREATLLRGALEREWPGCELIVVTVGYSSRDVRDLLGTIIDFDERTFEGLLQTELTRLAARRQSTLRVGPPPTPDPELRNVLERISNRLNELESIRDAASAGVEERFAQSTAVLAEPERKERELKTRWDLLEAIDDLEAGQDIDTDRRLMRSALVANEAYRRDAIFDQLGGIYLDLLALFQQVNVRSATGEDFWRKADELRHDLLSEMRRTLRRGGQLNVVRAQPVVSALVTGVAVALAVFALLAVSVNWVTSLIFAVAAFTGVFGGVSAFLILRMYDSVRPWERRLANLRASANKPAT